MLKAVGIKKWVYHMGTHNYNNIVRAEKLLLNKRFWKLTVSAILVVVYISFVVLLAGLVYTCPANPLSPVYNWISSLS